MKLSNLQKFILKTVWENSSKKNGRISRNIFEKFYANIKNPPPKKIRANIITMSIERLINKGLLIGFGEKTQHKLFITEVKSTPKGKTLAQSLIAQQTKLPFKNKRRKNK